MIDCLYVFVYLVLIKYNDDCQVSSKQYLMKVIKETLNLISTFVLLSLGRHLYLLNISPGGQYFGTNMVY